MKEYYHICLLLWRDYLAHWDLIRFATVKLFYTECEYSYWLKLERGDIEFCQSVIISCLVSLHFSLVVLKDWLLALSGRLVCLFLKRIFVFMLFLSYPGFHFKIIFVCFSFIIASAAGKEMLPYFPELIDILKVQLPNALVFSIKISLTAQGG